MNHNENIIKTDNLTKRFGRTMAVDGLNLEIKKGEIFGLVGPDGAGKTTTIRMLAAIMDPTALPSASPGAPWIAATTLTAVSGSVVPRLTIVAPMSIFGTPHLTASDTAWSTSMSAPFAGTAREATVIKKRTTRGSCSYMPESRASIE